MEFDRDLEIVSCHHFREVLLSACFISGLVTKLGKLRLMLFEKESRVKGYK